MTNITKNSYLIYFIFILWKNPNISWQLNIIKVSYLSAWNMDALRREVAPVVVPQLDG